MFKYSVLIPTRNRAKYLESSLRSVLKSGRNDVQIVVSDNSDENQVEAVHAVIASAPANSIKYVRPDPAPVGMSENWEFALSHAQGQYITIIGDDDALVPSAFAVADRVIETTDAPAVRWPWAFYNWPDYPMAMHCDKLDVPLAMPNQRYHHSWMDGQDAIRNLTDWQIPYANLPMLYNSFVRQDVIQELFRSPHPGLRSTCPDIYSGLAVAHLSGRFVTLNVPLGIAGQGAKSNGVANLVHPNRELVTDFDQLNRQVEPNQVVEPPKTPTLAYAVAESIIRFHEAYPESATSAPLNVREMLMDTARQLNRVSDHQAEHTTHFDSLINRYPDHAIELQRIQQSWSGGNTQQPMSNLLGFNGSNLTVRPSQVGITDVAGAAALTEMLSGHDPEQFGKASEPLSTRDILRDFIPPAAWRLAGWFKQRFAR